MTGPGSTCLVCAAPLTALHARTAPLCGGAACHARYDATPPFRRCTVCARPLAELDLAGRVCRGACARKQMRDTLRARELDLETRAATFRERAAARVRVRRADDFAVTILPRHHASRSALPAKRRRALAARVAALAAEAAARRDRGEPAPPADAGPVDRPELSAVLGAACGQCRGRCCSRGGDHAYLDVDVVHRWLAAHPGHDADAAVDAWLAHVAPRTIRDSCAFHGASGCTLPRDMRSNTCNRFLCGSLTQLRVAAPAAGTVRAFVATVSAPGSVAPAFAGGAFIDSTAVRVVRDLRDVRELPAGGTSPALPGRPPA